MWAGGLSKLGQICLGICLYACFLTGYAQTPLWEALPFRLDRYPDVFYEDTVEDRLYIGGVFTAVDTHANPLQFFAWDGQQYELFSPPSFRLPFPPRAFARYKGRLYMGGFRGLAYRENGIWTKVHSDTPVVYHLSIWRDKLLAAGRFENLARQGIGQVGVWDGQKWEELFGIDTVLEQDPYGCDMFSIAEYKGELYVGGNNNDLDRRSTHWKYSEILRWDGHRWKDVGGGIHGGGLGEVNAMVVYKGELYVGGIFEKQYGAAGDHLMRWDGHRWRDVGGSIQGWTVADMLVYQDELWVVGSFYGAGGIPAQHIAKWDGERWCGVGSRFDNATGPLGTFRGELYIGGGFWSIDGDSSLAYIAKWIGGAYVDTCGPRISNAVEAAQQPMRLNVWPNPARDILHCGLPETGRQAVVNIYDLTGRNVFTQRYPGNDNKVKIDITDFPSGMYILRLTLNNNNYVAKWVK